MYKKTKKVIALTMVLIMLLANLSTVGIHVGEVIAASIDAQNAKTNNSNVEFNTYFISGGEKVYEANKNVNEENTIVAEVAVKNAGYLKNARIEFVDSNFIIGEVKSDYVEKMEGNTLLLEQINSDEVIKIEIPVKFENNSIINLDDLSKESSVKFTADYLGGNGKEKSIKKDLDLKLNWTAKTELEVSEEITKYIPFEIEDNKGLLIETEITERIKDGVLPIKESNIEVEVPQINKISPDRVTVYSNDIEINEENYIYNKEDSQLIIKATNEVNENGEVEFKTENKYVVTYTYSEDALEEDIEEINAKLSIKDNVVIYSCDEAKLEATYTNEVALNEEIGTLTDTRIEVKESLSKAYMYANLVASEKIETTYIEKIITQISNEELVDQIVIDLNQDQYITENSEINASTVYKTIEISKADFEKYFGEDGKIEIILSDGTIKEIVLDSFNGGIEKLNVDINSSFAKITTSNPKSVGEFVIYTQKSIIETDLKEKQIISLKTIKTSVNEIVKEIELTELTMETALQISEENLSTVIKNENVELRAILNTSTLNNKLFKNPTITINLPSYFETIEVKNVQLLFDEELEITDANLIDNADGSKQIVIKLAGTQTKYSLESSYKGANIVVNADITVNKLTPSKQDQITMQIKSNGEETQNEVKVNYVAPVGLVTVNEISNFAVGASLMAIANDVEGTLEIQTQSKIATAKIQVINNYDNKIENVKILGRTLVKGTTDTDSDENLENTFDAPMIAAINTNGLENVSVYYSTNGSASKDLTDLSNGWTQDVTDFSSVKSYLIVLNDYTMEKGDSVTFTYDVKIPENLNYSEEVASVYTVNFDNVQENQVIQDRVTSMMLRLGTGNAPDLTINLSSYSQENSVVRENQIIKFKATIKNNGTVDSNNTVVTIPTSGDNYTARFVEFVEEDFRSEYVESDKDINTINLGTIKSGESKEIVYEIKIKDVNSSSSDIMMNNKISVIADTMQKSVESNEYNLKIEKANMNIDVMSSKTEDSILTKGRELSYTANVENIMKDGSTLNNVVVTFDLPKGINAVDAKAEVTNSSKPVVNIDNANSKVTFTVDKLEFVDQMECIVNVKVGDAIGKIEPLVSAKADNSPEHYGNIVTNEVDKLQFKFEQKKLDDSYVKEGEEITFEYTIENLSQVYCDNFKFENIVPEGMKLVGAQIKFSDDNIQKVKNASSDKLTINSLTFVAMQKVGISVTMKADMLPNGTTEKVVTNNATISGSLFDSMTSESVKVTIEYNKNLHTSSGQGGSGTGSETVPEDGRYVISGVAWLDENEDGQRNDKEELLSGIEVRLLNKNTNEIVKDVDTGKEKITTTSSNGEYTFTNLEEGEYLVVIIYNSAKYNLTQYRKTAVGTSINSDFIDIVMNIDGTDKTVAISDTIGLVGTNARNIDIGLCNSTESDLKLDKYISAISLTYGNTTKSYKYENASLAKVEIPANSLSNATVVVTYKIVVKNEAGIANYVKKIVDYIPKDMKFSAELNKDWYQSSNGDIYNSSLANTLLQPGESKEVTLTLSRKMTDSNTGVVNNNAEIYEVYNEEGIKDKDSTPANKISSEDDMSAADVVISVKTGDAIIYTAIIATVISLGIGLSAYIIKKKVLSRI